MFRAVIFDMDGVLVDSEVIVTRIESEMLAALGADISVAEIVATFTGLSDAVMAETLLRDWNVVLPDSFDAERRERTFAAFETDLEAVAGIDAALGALVDRDVLLAVASSSSPERIAHSLKLTKLAKYFGEHLYSAAMVSHGKPAPDLFLFAADKLGVDPGDCVVVEDSAPGVVAGVAACMEVIGFTAGGHCGPEHAQRLIDAGATHVAATAAKLVGRLLESRNRDPGQL